MCRLRDRGGDRRNHDVHGPVVELGDRNRQRLDGGAGVASAQPPANACGNSFNYPLLTSDNWQLYKIPFSAFTQSFQPDRVPKGFDPSTFYNINVLVPKEAELQLWVDDLGFYPHKDGGL